MYLTIIYRIMEFRPRKHEDIKKIVDKAESGDAFFVNRAARNGDLAPLPEDLQRLIVAVANDHAAAYASDSIIPLTDERYTLQQEFVEKHLDHAVRAITKAGGKTLKDLIEEFYG